MTTDEAITEAKAAGKTPIGISCTAGTTVLGAYDDIEAIADVAEKHGVWLHVDACWGGHCLLSAKHSHLMKGCHRADSIAWTATKCLGLPQQCSVLILKKRNVLYNCNAMNEDYLFHDHEEKDFDLGDRTLNCGRRVDALKLWLSWKVYGDKGFAQRVEHAFEQAQSLVQMIKERGDRFQLLTEPESLNVCFWYVPKAARSLPEGKDKYELMDKATLTIRRKMQLEGKVLVNYSDLSGVHGHFFRMITCNPFAGVEDIAFMLDEMERLGEL
ncbi:Acidic amino acid decarboxylase GADL1-like [Balamuthia mandrillaris]